MSLYNNSKIYVEAPNRLDCYSSLDIARTVFLAGSISGAKDWQKDVAAKFLPHFNVFNPRRANYDALDPKNERDQIFWEHTYLDVAGITIFYFDHSTLAPITLLEYGKQLVKCRYAPWRKTYVAIHPSYKRKNDVMIQTELENAAALKNIFLSLDEMVERVIEENK